MASGRAREYRYFAAECLSLAHQNADACTRVRLTEMAQRWIDLAELIERASLSDRAVQDAIGRELKNTYRCFPGLPPHILALLAQLNLREQNGDGAG